MIRRSAVPLVQRFIDVEMALRIRLEFSEQLKNANWFGRGSRVGGSKWDKMWRDLVLGSLAAADGGLRS